MLVVPGVMALSVGLALGMDASASERPVRVVVTTPTLAWIVKEVGGAAVEPVTLLRIDKDGRYEDAHSPPYRADRMLALREAKLIIKQGLRLEDAWLSLLPGTVQLPTLDLGSALQLSREGEKGREDTHPLGNPHYLLDPRKVLPSARIIGARLAELRPSKASSISSRVDQFERRLGVWIDGWKKSIRAVPARSVVSYHAGFTYFLEFAGWSEFATIELKPGIPPTPEHVARVLVQMRQNQVKLVWLEKTQPSAMAAYLAEQTGGRVVEVRTEDRDYKALIDGLVLALKESPTPRVMLKRGPSPSPTPSPLIEVTPRAGGSENPA